MLLGEHLYKKYKSINKVKVVLDDMLAENFITEEQHKGNLIVAIQESEK